MSIEQRTSDLVTRLRGSATKVMPGVPREQLLEAAAKYESAVNTLHDIAALGKKAGSELAKHRLAQLGEGVPDYGSMT